MLWPLTEHGMAETVHEQQGVEVIPLDILQNTKYLKEMCNFVVKRLDGFQFLYLKLRYGNLTYDWAWAACELECLHDPGCPRAVP